MIQIVLTIYGIVALVRGKFHIGRNKEVVGTRARILGALSTSTVPLEFIMGMLFGTLDILGVLPMPDISLLRAISFGIIIGVLIAVISLGKRFYRLQEEEREMAEPVQGNGAARYYPVVDPNNPFASPSVKD